MHNTAGHIDYRTGRMAVTVAEALRREDCDSPLYLYSTDADEIGIECWRLIDGIDPAQDGRAFDLWFPSASTPETVQADSCVYLGKKESLARIAKATIRT